MAGTAKNKAADTRSAKTKSATARVVKTGAGKSRATKSKTAETKSAKTNRSVRAGKPAGSANVLPRFVERWRSLAETRCAAAGERLTPARLAAYAELQESGKPLSAYDLLALLEVRQERKIAPLTVYRHLDFLMRVGLVHRIESTQSYLPCDHPDHQHESQYLLCSACGGADELESKQLQKLLSQMAAKRGFKSSKAVVEVTGVCANCIEEGD